MPCTFKMEEDWKYSMEYKENSLRTGWFSHFPCGVCGSLSVSAMLSDTRIKYWKNYRASFPN